MKKNNNALKKIESKAEEIANFVSHTAGAGLAILGFIMLIIRASWYNNIPALVSYIIFSLGLMVLYTMSSIYHGLKPSTAKNVFEILDHSSIYFLIAASYTPFLVLGLKSNLGITLLVIQWIICIIGITFKAFFTGKFKGISTIVYLIMGWMIVFSWNELIAKISPISLGFLITGGILYSLGTVFYMWKVCKFNHMIWHIFVILGSI
ncbi:MAG: hemolysin III family protein, partial [Fusobacterium sp.]|nr:hemolysin III family protein [Fusobacterium sp.]